MDSLFSKRFRKALKERKIIPPSFRRPLRKRMAMICHDYRVIYNSFECADTEEDAMLSLEKAYGMDSLKVQDVENDGERGATDFNDFLVYAYPEKVIDALEAFYRLLPDDIKLSFQKEINAVLTEEDSPWRISDGQMYMVDSRFLDALKDQVEEDLRFQEFLGAHEEFKEARRHLQAGEHDDAIHKANRAFESTLKTLLNQRDGTADDLLKNLRAKTDLLDGVPEEAQKAFVSKILQGLPVLRHKLGGHGQGANPIEIQHAYGDLAVNLAATYIKFLLDLKKELEPKQKQIPRDEESDLPF